MHYKKEEIPIRPGGDDSFRSVRAGDMEIGFTRADHAFDCTPMYKGLPNDMCPCDHYGYVVTGKLRARYADGTEEVISAGSVYWIPKGHWLIYEEPTTHVEINPHRELDQAMAVIMKNIKEAEANALKES